MAINHRSNVYEGGLTVDPTVGAGVPATIGSILLRSGTTQLWQKVGAGDTQWQLYNGVTSAVTVINAMSPYAILPTDNWLFVDTTGGPITLQLPNPAQFGVPFSFRLIDVSGTMGTNHCFLAPFAAELVEGLNASKELQTAWGGWTVVTDRTNWFLF